MRKLFIRSVAFLMISCIAANSESAVLARVATTSLQPSFLQSRFTQQALIGRLAGVVVFGQHGNPRAHKIVHTAYDGLIGADTGGDLKVMSRLLRYIDKLSAVSMGPDWRSLSRPYRLHELLGVHYRPQPYDADLIASVLKDAERLLRQAGLPRPRRSEPLRIILLDLPDNRHARRFVRRFLEPERGVRALHYEIEHSGRTIVMLRDDFTARRLAHELGEIALMQRNRQLHWTEAHNMVNAAGLGRGEIDILHLSLEIPLGELLTIVSHTAQPLSAQAVTRLFAEYGVPVSSELLAELQKGFDVFYALAIERFNAMDEISAAEAKRDGVNFSLLSTDESAMEILRRSIGMGSAMHSDEELLSEAVGPLLDRHKIPLHQRSKILKDLLNLMAWDRELEGVLGSAFGAPLDDLIDKLTNMTGFPAAEAQRIAVNVARRFGWTETQIAKALRDATLASSQNEIGADVGDENKEDIASAATRGSSNEDEDAVERRLVEELERPVPLASGRAEWRRPRTEDKAAIDKITQTLLKRHRLEISGADARQQLILILKAWGMLDRFPGLRDQLENHLDVAAGLTDHSPAVPMPQILHSAEWLRRFFRIYQHAFYVIRVARSDSVIVISPIRRMIPVQWREFSHVIEVDPDAEDTTRSGGFALESTRQEVVVIRNDRLLVDPSLVALHEAEHQFQRLEFAAQAKIPTEADLEFAGYARTLIEIGRRTEEQDRLGIPRLEQPQQLVDAFAGMDGLEAHLDFAASRGEPHLAATRRLMPSFLADVLEAMNGEPAQKDAAEAAIHNVAVNVRSQSPLGTLIRAMGPTPDRGDALSREEVLQFLRSFSRDGLPPGVLARGYGPDSVKDSLSRNLLKPLFFFVQSHAYGQQIRSAAQSRYDRYYKESLGYLPDYPDLSQRPWIDLGMYSLNPSDSAPSHAIVLAAGASWPLDPLVGWSLLSAATFLTWYGRGSLWDGVNRLLGGVPARMSALLRAA